jgi:hypothetical protein
VTRQVIPAYTAYGRSSAGGSPPSLSVEVFHFVHTQGASGAEGAQRARAVRQKNMTNAPASEGVVRVRNVPARVVVTRNEGNA